MNLQEYVDKMKKLQSQILEFLDNEEASEKEYKKLIDLCDNQISLFDRYEFKLILLMIVKISNNHHRFLHFYTKIEAILRNLLTKISKTFTNSEIFNIFKSNKMILLFLIEEKILVIDEYIESVMKSNKFKSMKYPEFFSHEIELFHGTEKQEENDFYEKRKIGENDNYICKLIQKDLIDEFIPFVSKNNISIKSTKIPESIYETNIFLLKNQPNLIEYSAFYGSIQILKYLYFNQIELIPSLWLYAIHSKNPEIIQFLDEKKIEPIDKNYVMCLKESIKCHHNDFAEYIMCNFINENDIQFSYENFENNIFSYSFHYFNFFYFPNKIDELFVFYYACKYDYFKIVKNFMNKISYEINNKIILLFFYESS